MQNVIYNRKRIGKKEQQMDPGIQESGVAGVTEWLGSADFRFAFENRAKRGRFVLEFGHLGRILARSPRFFRNVFSINTGLPDLASGPFCAEGVRPEGPRAQAKADARQLKRLNVALALDPAAQMAAKCPNSRAKRGRFAYLLQSFSCAARVNHSSFCLSSTI